VVAKQDNERRGAGRPPLTRFTLTEQKIAGSMTPGQRETIIAVLADIILTALAPKRRAERCLPEPADWPCDPRREEGAGQSPGS
jgi:hypothetical protein